MTRNDRRYSVQDEIPVAKFEPAEGHGHPALHVCGEKDNRTIFDDHFEVAVEILEDEIKVFFRREHV